MNRLLLDIVLDFRDIMNRKTCYKIAAVIIVGASLTAFAYYSLNAKDQLIRSPFYQYFLHTFRSFRKLADIPYLIYKPIPDNLPVYELALSTKDIAELDRALPQDPIKGRLTDEYKTEVKAYFRSGDYLEQVKVRYRGWEPNHWNAMKKSYFIKFSSEAPFNGYKEISFIIPEDRSYGAEALNIYRAQKLGLFAPKIWFAHIKLNGQDMGVYLAIPHWYRNLLETNKIQDASNIFVTKDLSLQDQKQVDFFDPKNIDLWKDAVSNTDTNPQGAAELKNFLELLYNAPEAILEKTAPIAINMDDFYSWMILNSLTSSSHQNKNNNSIFLRNSIDNKFSPIPWDVGIFKPGPVRLDLNILAGRILSIPVFRDEYLKRLSGYVSNPGNLRDDLAYYDKITAEIKIPLYKDLAKLPLNYQVGKDISKYRKMIEQNFNYVKDTLVSGNTNELFQGSAQVNINPDYKLPPFYEAASAALATFLALHPQFYPQDEDTVAIGPGSYTISEDVVVPAKYSLDIKPGTTLFINGGASIISWNKLTAQGKPDALITIKKANEKPWGNILIIGAPNETSILKFVNISGGSGFHKYGITQTGMLAFAAKGQNVVVKNSSFNNSYDDDELNIKYGNVLIENNTFNDSYSDAIDLDVSTGIVRGNTFTELGFRQTDKPPILDGDGIDISFSKIEISYNVVLNCADKGLSLGEVSEPTAHDNFIYDCNFGAAVKDRSQAHMDRNYFIANRTSGVDIKEKKSLYGPGQAWVTNSLFWKNKQDISIENNSNLAESTNNILGIIPSSTLDFKIILPPEFYRIFETLNISK